MQRSAFFRKIGYVVLLALMLLVVNWLFRPAAGGREGAAGDPGGVLAQMRDRYHLGQTYLGDVDPTGETIKLTTLGMRGVAANILWTKANDYKVRKDWSNLAATLRQLAKLQPTFVGVWEFQAWNIAFNVSAEFDDYRQRYRWVIRGIDYLREGMRYNEREAILPWEVGWFIYQKMGRSDERKQFRRLFREDDDFHGSRPLAERDSWLVAREWYLLAIDMVEHRGATMRKKGPHLYRSDPAMCLINYAANLESDGTFGEVAKRAWMHAARSWDEYGAADIPTTDGLVIRLGEKELHVETVKRLTAELDALQPGLRETIVKERRASLSEEQREALDTPAARRDGRKLLLAGEAEERIMIRPLEIAERVSDGAARKKAVAVAEELQRTMHLVEVTERYREIVNYEYWRLRTQVEQSDELIAAHKFLYEGNRAYADGDLLAARKAYDQGLAAWRQVLDNYPALRKDDITIDDLLRSVEVYKAILDQLDEPLPKDFPLREIVRERLQGVVPQ